MTENETTITCPSCGGRLEDLDDYRFHRAIRLAICTGAIAAIICGIWAPLFFLVRLIIGGAIGQVGVGVVLLLVKKIFAGAIIGILLGAAAGIGGAELGLFLGAVIGSLGGFFIAATDALPLLSDAAHRLDIVIVSILSGILCAATVHIAESKAKKKHTKWIGPEPKSDDKK